MLILHVLLKIRKTVKNLICMYIRKASYNLVKWVIMLYYKAKYNYNN